MVSAKQQESQERWKQMHEAQIRQQLEGLNRQQIMGFQQLYLAQQPVFLYQPFYYYQPPFIPQYAPQHQYAPQYQYPPQYQYVQQTVYAQQPVYAPPPSYAQQPVYAQRSASAQQAAHAQNPAHDRQSGKSPQPQDAAHAPCSPPIRPPQQTASGKTYASFGPVGIHLERLQSLQDWLHREQNPFSLKTEAEACASPKVETEAIPMIKTEDSPTIKIEEASPPSSRTDTPSMASPVLRVTESLIQHQSSAPPLSPAAQPTPVKSEPSLDSTLINPRKRSRSSSRVLRPKKRVCPRIQGT